DAQDYGFGRCRRRFGSRRGDQLHAWSGADNPGACPDCHASEGRGVDTGTGAISSRQIPLQVQQQAPSASARPVAFLPPSRAAAIPTSAPAIPDSPSPSCGNPDALGVSRVVEIDTVGGPGFGFEQFKAYDFLREKEVVLTFDDGPWPGNTPAVLKALADQCTKALFFPVGKHAVWHPEILKQVAAAGHTVGSHTWSHADLSKLTVDQAKEE